MERRGGGRDAGASGRPARATARRCRSTAGARP